MTEMTPREIVQELDKHIIGQLDAKRAVANALRNRWRRLNVESEELRAEITPKNILMIGPTGVGKTEIARRLAKLANAPFIKVEASKFTEVGYVGREVDSIVRDLLDMAIKLVREQRLELVQTRAEDAAEERVLEALNRKPRPPRDDSLDEDSDKVPEIWSFDTMHAAMKSKDGSQDLDSNVEYQQEDKKEKAGTKMLRSLLRQGKLDDKVIEIEVSTSIGVEIFGPPGLEEMTSQLQGMMQNMGNRKSRTRKVTV